MEPNQAWANCVLVAAVSGLVTSVMANQGLRKPTSNAQVIHLGIAQDVVLAGLLGYVTYRLSPFDSDATVLIAFLVGGDHKRLADFIRDWFSKK